MKLTPLDIQQHGFRKRGRGYDQKDVDTFLEHIRLEWEDLLRANHEQEMSIRELSEQISRHADKERTLQDTLVSAQKLAQDMKEAAKKEAEIVIGQAELQAEKIIHQAHQRLIEILDEINELKRRRAEFEGKLRGLVESHMRLLDLQNEARESAQIEDVSVLPRAT